MIKGIYVHAGVVTVAKAKVKKYKLKTHKATAKRFRATGTGKIVRTKGGKSHFRRRRSTRSKQALDKVVVVKKLSTTKRINTLAPYLRHYKANPPS
jgi:large subunit ribosomal protein L35